MEEYLGIEVPDNAHGVLQDVHWSAGLIGYFSTYLLGTVMSVQLWEKLVLATSPDLDEQIERGEFGAMRDWLARTCTRAAASTRRRRRCDEPCARPSTRSRTSRI